MRVFLYGRPAVAALAAAASLIERTGHTAQYRRDGLFTADQTEPCDAVVVQLGLDTTGPIAEAYGAKEVPVFGVPVDEHLPAVIRSGGFAGLATFIGYDLGPVLAELEASEQAAASAGEESRAQLEAAAAERAEAERQAADAEAAAAAAREAEVKAAELKAAAAGSGSTETPSADAPPAGDPANPAPSAEPPANPPAGAPDAAPASGSRRRGGGR